MTNIRYVFGILKTGEIIEEFSLQGVSMKDKLNDWGDFQGTYALDQSGKMNVDLVGSTIPGQCFVCCEKDGVPVWFGIIWSRTYQSQAKTIQLRARTLSAYPDKRRIKENFTYTSEDQGEIFLDLWNSMQGTPEGDIGIIVPGSFTTGVTMALDIRAADLKTYFDVMSSIADGDSGFDWRISTVKNAGGSYDHTLLTGSPLLGSSDHTLITFEYTGNITNYYETESVTEGGTNIILSGTGTGEDAITSEYVHTDLLASGIWPIYDVVVPRKDVSEQLVLDALAMRQGALRRPPMAKIKIFVRGEADPVFGSYSLGDACRLYFTDPKHEEGAQYNTRIVAWNYWPSSGDNIDEVELIFEGDELNE